MDETVHSPAGWMYIDNYNTNFDYLHSSLPYLNNKLWTPLPLCCHIICGYLLNVAVWNSQTLSGCFCFFFYVATNDFLITAKNFHFFFFIYVYTSTTLEFLLIIQNFPRRLLVLISSGRRGWVYQIFLLFCVRVRATP